MSQNYSVAGSHFFSPKNRVLSWCTSIVVLMASMVSSPALAALCTVDTGGGGDYTTIQEAIDDTNCDPIEIAPGAYNENLVIERALTLTGQNPDASLTVVDGGALDSVIRVNVVGGPDVSISNLTVQNGLADRGAGIYAGTGLVLDNVIMQQNVANLSGGGIYVFDGPLTMTNATVTGNEAGQAGAGVDIRFDSSIADSQITDNHITTGGGVTLGGAGLHNRSNLSVTNTIISGNTTTISGGGIFNNAEFDTLTLTNVTIENNEVTTYAAGIYNFAGNLVIESSLIRNNTGTVFSGGGIFNNGTATISDSEISGHTASWTGAGIENQGDVTLVRSDVLNNASSGRGGGIFTSGGSLTLEESTVEGNSAVTFGGGIYLDSASTSLTITDSEISANMAELGGGMQTNTVTVITGSTISGNSATSNGGGVYGTGASVPVTFTNSTLSGNSGTSGGAIYLSGSIVTVNNSTITNNSASSEFAVAGLVLTGGVGTATVRNSIIANQALGIDCAVSGIVSAGYNIESQTGCGFTETGDLQNSDPLLQPLADNGGPTQTHALDELSPAIDTANPAGCEADLDGDGTTETSLIADQRGIARVDIELVGNDGDDYCDIGAYEYAAGLYTIGGSVSGLVGTGLVLQNNGVDDETISVNGAFTFDTALPNSSPYEVTVLQQPSNPNQTCTVSNGAGTLSGANVTNVTVECETNTYVVAGTVTGLTGTGLVLQNNGKDNKTITANGKFVFDTPLPDGGEYSVTVFSQPGSPSQVCSVNNASGKVSGGPVTTVEVICSVNSYIVGGTVQGLAGEGLLLRINGGDDEQITSNGDFKFDTPLADGSLYRVSVRTQPSNPNQTCRLRNNTGQINGADVTNVQVRCQTNTYLVGGQVTGLLGQGLVLQNNGGDNKPIGIDGPFAFDTRVPDLSPYDVTVLDQPTTPAQVCTVSNGTGNVSGGAVTDIAVSCVLAAEEVFSDGFEALD